MPALDNIWESGGFVLQVDILGLWQVPCCNGETEGERIFGGKVKCVTHGQPIGWHYPIALHRLRSAPPAEAYLAPFIMHGRHPPPMHRPVMARSLRQLSPTLLFPLRGCKRLHNSDAARCFSRLISYQKCNRQKLWGGFI